MKLIHLDFGCVELCVRIGWPSLTCQVPIQKYDILSRDFAPEIERFLLRRVKAELRHEPLPPSARFGRDS